MFDELDKYKSNDHFFFTKNVELKEVCNAPKNGIGIYLVYALKEGGIELIYVGSSGKILHFGEMKIRSGGIGDRIINGKQFGEPRRISWKNKVENENIDALDIYWYETFDKNNNDIPSTVEGIIIQQHFNLFGRLPIWNKEI